MPFLALVMVSAAVDALYSSHYCLPFLPAESANVSSDSPRLVGHVAKTTVVEGAGTPLLALWRPHAPRDGLARPAPLPACAKHPLPASLSRPRPLCPLWPSASPEARLLFNTTNLVQESSISHARICLTNKRYFYHTNKERVQESVRPAITNAWIPFPILAKI